MSENVADEISRLPTLSRADLLSLWRELFRQPAHPKLRRDLIVPILAYKLQEKAYGGLKPSTRRRLREIAEELERDRHAHVRSKPSFRCHPTAGISPSRESVPMGSTACGSAP